jgi:8-oxo-dGTP pyrophosphatase MutT (NUDIX family)
VSSTVEALGLVTLFSASPEEEKSRELILALLEQTPSPFARNQFHPGHITCTAVVLDPPKRRVLLAYHHRLRRWLLPGGHVEADDVTLGDVARREAIEETEVRISRNGESRLVGMDVHGIPANQKKGEPFHLHHDLIFAWAAESDVVTTTEEAPEVVWCAVGKLDRYGVPGSIVRAVARAMEG